MILRAEYAGHQAFVYHLGKELRFVVIASII